MAKKIWEVELDFFPPDNLDIINIESIIQKFWKYQLTLRLEYKKIKCNFIKHLAPVCRLIFVMMIHYSTATIWDFLVLGIKGQ